MASKKVKTLAELEAEVQAKRTEWLAAYDREKAGGVAVVMRPNSKLKKLWDELTALREERNTLLDQLRSNEKLGGTQ